VLAPPFKQFDPAPRYHARDAAVVLAQQFKAKVLMGSATPAIESYFNARQGKYGLATLTKRYGDIQLPEMVVADMREEAKRKTLQGHFTSQLLTEMEAAIARKEQVILFQNRRGFSPYVICTTCGWTPECERCDVSLTYHKYLNKLKCHYCGFQQFMPQTCPACGSATLQLRGLGTEKVEEDLSLMYPEWRVKRMDLDTTRGKHAYQRLINELEDHQIDVLVGTQMVTKGLDFENVGLVGILQADSLLNFPDFRAHERSFQLMAQVAGRAGRKKRRGKVVIQTYKPEHPIIQLVLQHDYESMYGIQTGERLDFQYPPYFRLIKLTLSHRDKERCLEASDWLGDQLRQAFGKRVLGPEYPLIARIKNRYLRQILLKVERNRSFLQSKETLKQVLIQYANHPEHHKVRVIPDVDPY